MFAFSEIFCMRLAYIQLFAVHSAGKFQITSSCSVILNVKWKVVLRFLHVFTSYIHIIIIIIIIHSKAKCKDKLQPWQQNKRVKPIFVVVTVVVIRWQVKVWNILMDLSYWNEKKFVSNVDERKKKKNKFNFCYHIVCHRTAL